MDAVVDSAAMVTLIREDFFKSAFHPLDFGPVCVLSGIGTDPVHGRLVHNVPISVGTQTFLHTVCVAPIKDICLLGLDFMIATGCILNLSERTLTVDDETIPVTVNKHPGMQISNVSIVRRTVLRPHSVGFVPAHLDTPIDGTYMVTGVSNKKALVSNVYGCGSSVVLKVINDSDSFVTLKKGKSIGHAEPAELAFPDTEHSTVNSATQKGAKHSNPATQNLPEHLQQMYADNISDLSDNEKLQFKELLIEYQDVFSKDDFDLGCLSSGVEHKIQTHDEIPIAEKFRRTPLHFQKQEQEYLEKLLKQGVIEPSVSEWSAPPVLVRKKTGELRYCIDYRSLNAKTYKDNYNLPLIEDCLDSLHGKKLFCILDLCSGYYQIKLEENSRKKTSFNTRFGSFQWTRLPMGLCTAGATFSRAMSLVMRGLQWEEVIVYLDDIIVLGTDFNDTIASLRKVLDRFRQHNLKLKPRKCHFFRRQVEFLGKWVSGDGTAIAPDKLEAVKTWPVPQNAKELMSFLGFMNYHRNHMPDFAKVSSDLFTLAHAKDFVWTRQHQACFDKLKNLAISAPMLAHASPDGLFILDCDASGSQIGAELSQVQNGVIKPICYASHILLKQHRNYCTTRKELLAVVKFCRQFRHYLLGRHFLVRTDHNSLVWLTRFRHLEGQLARWLEELSQYDFKILHRRGVDHQNADSLSRLRDPLKECDCYRAGSKVEDLPCGGCPYCRRAHRQWARFNEDVDDVIPLSVRSVDLSEPEQSLPVPESSPSSNWLESMSSLQLRQAQLDDRNIGTIIHWLEHNYEPSTRTLQLCSPETRALWLMRDQLCFRDSVLFYVWTDCENRSQCLVVPAELRLKVLYYCHDSRESGHLGQSKTLDKLKERFYWYGMSKDSNMYVKQCATCNRNKKGNRTPRSAQMSYHAGYPMERVHLDILGPINPKSRSGSSYVLVMVDQFTKWCELSALPAMNAELTAKAFLNHFIVNFGCPLEVHTDQGRNFTSDLFLSFCRLFEITKTRTTPYHPSSNGQCEVFNRTILQMIRSYVSRGMKDWDEHLPLISMALHSMKNKSTGFSANQLMLGREVLQPIDLILGVHRETPQNPSNWVSTLTHTLSEIHNLARENIGKTQLRQKRDYDLRVFERSYNVGDVVYLRDSSTEIGISSKLRPPWTGPFLVSSARPPIYRLCGRRKAFVVHHDRLKPCHDSTFPLWLQRKRHNLLTSAPIEETGDLGIEPDPETLSPDTPLGIDMFDPDETLPYMLGDDPDMLEDDISFDYFQQPGSQVSTEITSQGPIDLDPFHDQEAQYVTTQSDFPSVPRFSRTGRQIKTPSRFKD